MATGGREEKLPQDTDTETPRCHNTNVAPKRHYAAVRVEVVAGAINFLTERLHVEQEEVVKTMLGLLEAQSAAAFVSAGRGLAAGLFGEESVAELATSVCDNWPKLAKARADQPAAKDQLIAMTTASSGVCKKLLAALLCVTPHSMGTERSVSHYNNVRSSHRLGMRLGTANDRLLLSINGAGTAGFDPRPAVAAFLAVKDRRIKHPDVAVYQERDFVKKFFRAAGAL